MNGLAGEFRESSERYLQVPDPASRNLPSSFTPVKMGGGVYEYRDFGQFEVHKYPLKYGVRLNSAPLGIAFIGVASSIGLRDRKVFLYSPFDDDRLFKQVVVRNVRQLEPVPLDEKDGNLAIDFIHYPLLNLEIFRAMSVLSIEQEAIVQQDIEESAQRLNAFHRESEEFRRRQAEAWHDSQDVFLM